MARWLQTVQAEAMPLLPATPSVLQAGSDWFELHSGPFDVPCISLVYTKLHSPQGKSELLHLGGVLHLNWVASGWQPCVATLWTYPAVCVFADVPC